MMLNHYVASILAGVGRSYFVAVSSLNEIYVNNWVNLFFDNLIYHKINIWSARFKQERLTINSSCLGPCPLIAVYFLFFIFYTSISYNIIELPPIHANIHSVEVAFEVRGKPVSPQVAIMWFCLLTHTWCQP